MEHNLRAKGDTKGFHVEVSNNTITGEEIEKAEIVDINDIHNISAELEPSLTFSGAEQAFKRSQPVASEFYVSGGIAFTTSRFGVKTNATYPSLMLTTTLSLQRSDYAFILEKDDDSVSSCLDARTGQLMYLWSHSGDSLF